MGSLTSFYRGPDQVIRLEWGANTATRGGSGNYIQFRSKRNPFVDRIGELKRKKTDNQLFRLQDFETSDAKLAGWVKSAGGAMLCVAVATGIDTAWAVVPIDHSAWGHGCNSGNWMGRGAYYGVCAHAGRCSLMDVFRPSPCVFALLRPRPASLSRACLRLSAPRLAHATGTAHSPHFTQVAGRTRAARRAGWASRTTGKQRTPRKCSA